VKIDAMDISASGLRAQRIRMEAVANNLANVNTTSDGFPVAETAPDGTVTLRHAPYRRRIPLFSVGMEGAKDSRLGVSVAALVEDTSTEGHREYKPEHDHAVKNPAAPDFGYVYFPNVDPLMEFVEMVAASRAYEANVTAVEAFKSMGQASLRLLA
jgi:flagellar basal-body rod protein FlgC